MSRWGNCVLFALCLYARRIRAGREGYIVLRWSRLAKKTPHVLYGERRHGRLRLVSYAPAKPARLLLPPPLFRGVVRWGD